MKVAVALAVLLCVTGYAHSQAVGEACGGESNTCDADLMCNSNSKCVAKVDGACSTVDGADQCVTNAECKTVDGANKCTCLADHVAATDMESCRVKAGATCDNTTHCIEGASCVSDACTCPAATHAPSANNEKCLKKIGQSCSAVAECVQGNTACTSDECSCATNYMATDDNAGCKLALGQTCGENDDCGVNAMCNTTCTCKADFSTESGRCGMKVEETCQNNHDCVTNAKCDQNKCKCMEDYEADDDKFCKSTSGSQTVMASVVLLVSAMLTSRLL